MRPLRLNCQLTPYTFDDLLSSRFKPSRIARLRGMPKRIVRRFSVKDRLTLKRRNLSAAVSLKGATCTLRAYGEADLTRGGGCTLARHRAAFPGRPHKLDEPPQGVPMSNPPRLRDFTSFCGPGFCLSRQSTGVRGQPGESANGSPTAPSESAAQAARRAALKTVQKVLTAHWDTGTLGQIGFGPALNRAGHCRRRPQGQD
jgi:hypothetical protein